MQIKPDFKKWFIDHITHVGVILILLLALPFESCFENSSLPFSKSSAVGPSTKHVDKLPTIAREESGDNVEKDTLVASPTKEPLSAIGHRSPSIENIPTTSVVTKPDDISNKKDSNREKKEPSRILTKRDIESRQSLSREEHEKKIQKQLEERIFRTREGGYTISLYKGRETWRARVTNYTGKEMDLLAFLGEEDISRLVSVIPATTSSLQVVLPTNNKEGYVYMGGLVGGGKDKKDKKAKREKDLKEESKSKGDKKAGQQSTQKKEGVSKNRKKATTTTTSSEGSAQEPLKKKAKKATTPIPVDEKKKNKSTKADKRAGIKRRREATPPTTTNDSSSSEEKKAEKKKSKKTTKSSSIGKPSTTTLATDSSDTSTAPLEKEKKKREKKKKKNPAKKKAKKFEESARPPRRSKRGSKAFTRYKPGDKGEKEIKKLHPSDKEREEIEAAKKRDRESWEAAEEALPKGNHGGGSGIFVSHDAAAVRKYQVMSVKEFLDGKHYKAIFDDSIEYRKKRKEFGPKSSDVAVFKEASLENCVRIKIVADDKRMVALVPGNDIGGILINSAGRRKVDPYDILTRELSDLTNKTSKKKKEQQKQKREIVSMTLQALDEGDIQEEYNTLGDELKDFFLSFFIATLTEVCRELQGGGNGDLVKNTLMDFEKNGTSFKKLYKNTDYMQRRGSKIYKNQSKDTSKEGTTTTTTTTTTSTTTTTTTTDTKTPSPQSSDDTQSD